MLWRLMTFFLSFSDSVSMNLGECLLTRFETNYSLMARVLYQTQYSRNAKKNTSKILKNTTPTPMYARTKYK